MCLRKFDKKISAITQPAYQPRLILAETFIVSCDCICWDILKRKKMVRFQTYMSNLMEGNFNIFKKLHFEIFHRVKSSTFMMSTL